MTTWKCEVCGYVHKEAKPPECCPVCGADRDRFSQPGSWPCTIIAPSAPLC